MPWVEFEPTVPASERAKTVHARGRSATVTGTVYLTCEKKEWVPRGKFRTHFKNFNESNSSEAVRLSPYRKKRERSANKETKGQSSLIGSLEQVIRHKPSVDDDDGANVHVQADLALWIKYTAQAENMSRDRVPKQDLSARIKENVCCQDQEKLVDLSL
jgi:hypothetical protein